MSKLVCSFLPAVTLASSLLCISDTSLYAQGLTLYVAPNGNDAWSEKVAEPKDNDGSFASIVHARDTSVNISHSTDGGVLLVKSTGNTVSDHHIHDCGFEPTDTSTVGLLRGRCHCPIRPAAPDYGLVGTRAN